MIILGIETSCDETSAAIVKKSGNKTELLSNIVSSQIDIHKQYGGVVPEVAARHHVENIMPVITEALTVAKIKSEKIDLIAVTAGPGLITSLISGVQAAKALSFAWKKPLMAVNHIYAHLAANFLAVTKPFPAMCLVVSGGHTELIHLKSSTSYKKIGQTVDDAAGEAFDKVAKLLDLGYPGGPIVSKLAEAGSETKYNLPRPMVKSQDFNFSFSGLKTAVLYTAQDLDIKDIEVVQDLCASFQKAVIDVLVIKTIKAAKKYKCKNIFLSGGVAANKKLRLALGQAAQENGFTFSVPEFKLCTDNAGMIAIAAAHLAGKKMPKISNWQKINTDPNWELQ